MSGETTLCDQSPKEFDAVRVHAIQDIPGRQPSIEVTNDRIAGSLRCFVAQVTDQIVIACQAKALG